MSHDRSYWWVTQAKRAERGAWSDLMPAVQQRVKPLLELHPVTVEHPEDGGDPIPTKSLDEHIVQTVTSVARAGFIKAPFGWDLPSWSINDAVRCAQDVHPVTRLFDECRAAGRMPAVPVITLARDTNFRNAVRDVIASDGRGVIVRVKLDQFPKVVVERGMPALLKHLRVTPAEVHLVLDIEHITMTATNARVSDTIALMKSVDIRGEKWRSCVVVAGAFPNVLTGFKRGVNRVMRWDLIFYRQLLARATELPFLPDFGDYAVSAPKDDAVNANHRVMNPTPRIRFTCNDEFVISTGKHVGRSASVARAREYRYAAKQLTALRDCDSPTFSPGAHQLHGVALGRLAPGTPETWRRHGTSHHVTKVVEQLESIGP